MTDGDVEATLNLSPVKSRADGKPIPVQGKPPKSQKGQIATLSSGCVEAFFLLKPL